MSSSSTAPFDNKKFADSLLQSCNVHSNYSQNIIVITEDKVELCLLKHAKALQDKSAWTTPVTLFASLLLALVTSTFHDSLGLEAPAWKAVFVLGTIISAIWSVYAVVKSCNAKASIETIVAEIKSTNVAQMSSGGNQVNSNTQEFKSDTFSGWLDLQTLVDRIEERRDNTPVYDYKLPPKAKGDDKPPPEKKG